MQDDCTLSSSIRQRGCFGPCGRDQRGHGGGGIVAAFGTGEQPRFFAQASPHKAGSAAWFVARVRALGRYGSNSQADASPLRKRREGATSFSLRVE